jgi:hypothetical protein
MPGVFALVVPDVGSVPAAWQVYDQHSIDFHRIFNFDGMLHSGIIIRFQQK